MEIQGHFSAEINSMLFLAASTAALGFVATSPVAAADPLRPNIVFIIADDLGSADLGYRG